MRWLGAVAAAVLCVAVVVLYHGAGQNGAVGLLSVEAIHEQAHRDAAGFGSAFRAAREEKLSAKAQEQMAHKDAAVQNNLELAAAEQTVEAKQAEAKFQAARKQQAALDHRLSHLAATMSSQKRQLSVALRELQAKEMLYSQASAAVPQLSSGLQRITADEQKLELEKKNNARAIKPIQQEISSVQAVLKKSEDAFTEDHMRTDYDVRQAKYAAARANLQQAKARVAAKQATFFTQKAEEAGAGEGPEKQKLLKEAQGEHDKTALLRAKAAEEGQKAQVWRAKAAEAASGLRMMGADVTAARQRLYQEEAAEAQIHKHLGMRMFERADGQEKVRLQRASKAKKALGGEVRELSAVVRRGEAELGATERSFVAARGADLSDRRAEAVGEQRMNGDLHRFTRDVEEAKDLQEAQRLHAVAAKRLGAAAGEAAKVAADAVHGGVQEMELGKFATEEAGDESRLRGLIRGPR